MESLIDIKNVSVKFRKYHGYSGGIKEAAMRMLRPPSWYAKKPPTTSTFWGLRHLNLTVKEGDRLGIIGRNGAGKSTLLKVISKIYRPSEGSVNVQGRIAPLIEIGAGFNPELTGRENAYLNGSILGISRKNIQSRLDSIVNFSELQDFIDMPVKYYSTGMHLRLAFTIATEIPPDILILDELYAGGDAVFITKANKRLESFVERSKILILVAHDLAYIKRFCNRVTVLGLTFKENCRDIRNTKVVDIVKELEDYGVKTQVVDPMAYPDEAKHEYGIQLVPMGDVPPAEAVILAVSHTQFTEMSIDQIKKLMKQNPVFIDVKGVFSKAAVESNGVSFWRL